MSSVPVVRFDERIVLEPRIVPNLALVAVEGVASFIRKGKSVPADVLEAVSVLDRLGAALLARDAATIERFRAGSGQGSDEWECDKVRYMDSKRAAEMLGIGVRAVTKRALSGGLGARRDGQGRWRLDRLAVIAEVENRMVAS